MEDFPSQIADFLEKSAARIRALTIDPIAKVITYVTLGLVALTLVVISFIFLLVGLFRIVEELIFKACDCSQAMELAYAVVGGLFLLVGALLWSRRTRTTTTPEDSE